MKQLEIERHPFLEMQIQSIDFSFRKVETLIVGTFPIYCITESIPSNKKGESLRENYLNHARFKFFYGSRKNHFWDIVAAALGCELPSSTTEAINLLNKYNLFLADTVSVAQRKIEYSPSDTNLVVLKYNKDLKQWIGEMDNLQRILFTSQEAKKQICSLFEIKFDKRKIHEYTISGTRLEFATLPTPAGNGRSVGGFYLEFPLSLEETSNKNAKKPFAKSYRQRIYTKFLS